MRHYHSRMLEQQENQTSPYSLYQGKSNSLTPQDIMLLLFHSSCHYAK